MVGVGTMNGILVCKNRHEGTWLIEPGVLDTIYRIVEYLLSGRVEDIRWMARPTVERVSGGNRKADG